MNGAKMKTRIGRPFGHRRVRHRESRHGRFPRSSCGFRTPARTCPGISAQNHPNRLASGSASRNAPGASSQVTPG